MDSFQNPVSYCEENLFSLIQQKEWLWCNRHVESNGFLVRDAWRRLCPDIVVPIPLIFIFIFSKITGKWNRKNWEEIKKFFFTASNSKNIDLNLNVRQLVSKLMHYLVNQKRNLSIRTTQSSCNISDFMQSNIKFPWASILLLHPL